MKNIRSAAMQNIKGGSCEGPACIYSIIECGVNGPINALTNFYLTVSISTPPPTANADSSLFFACTL